MADTADNEGTEEPLRLNTTEIDHANRDPKQIHQNMVKVDFEDVFAEPDGLHSLDCVWKGSHYIYRWSKLFLYSFLTSIFFIPLTLVLGLVIALLSFCDIWIITPCFKIVSVCLRRPTSAVIHTVCERFCGPLGRTFSSVTKTFRREA